MKTNHLLLSLLVFLSFNQFAQNGLNNMSFENWTTTLFGPNPNGWFGQNTSKQTAGAQNGASYLRLTNTSQSQGGLLLGTVTSFTGMVKGGEPFSQQPVSINGFFKTSGMLSSDIVGLTAYTTKNGVFTSIAQFTVSTNVSSWTSFSQAFMSAGPAAPDSIFITITTSNPTGGSANSTGLTFDLDNLSLISTPTGFDQRSIGTAFLVYPNPASNELNIYSEEADAVSILIRDAQGRTLDEKQMQIGKTKLDLINFKEGIYFYSILNKEGAVLLTNKLVVSH